MHSQGPSEQKPMKNSEKGSVGVSRDGLIFSVPLLSQKRVKLYERQIWQVHSQGPSEQKPIKKFWGKGAWVYPGTAEIFSVPPIISTNFKFCTHILSIDRNKSPLQISGKVAVGVVRTLEMFQGTYILCALRGRLCDSSAFFFSEEPIPKSSIC